MTSPEPLRLRTKLALMFGGFLLGILLGIGFLILWVVMQ